MRPPWVSPLVACKWGPWYPFFSATTSCCSQNYSMSPHTRGPAPYPSRVIRRCPRSTVSYDLWRSRKTRKSGSWSMLASFWESLISRMSVSINLPMWKTCRMFWKLILDLRRVSMIAFTTFHSDSRRLIPRLSVLYLVMRTKILHPSSVGIYLCCHIYCVSPIRSCHHYGFGGPDAPSYRYERSSIHFLVS